MQTAMLVVIYFLSISKSHCESSQSHWTERWKVSETVYNETGHKVFKRTSKYKQMKPTMEAQRLKCFCLQEKAEEVAVHLNDPSRGKPPNSHVFTISTEGRFGLMKLQSLLRVWQLSQVKLGVGELGWSRSDLVDSHYGPTGVFFQGGIPSPERKC